MAKWFESKQARAGSYSATYVVVFIAILAAVNYLAVQYNKTYDATELKLYSLSDQTLRVLDGLESDVKIYYFDEQIRFGPARASLVRYENASTRVSAQYVDVDADPVVARAMNVRAYGTTIVEVGVSRSEAPSTSEEDITNTIIKAIKGEAKAACFLTGHGEASLEDPDRLGLSAAAGEIQTANYTTRTISLLENPEVPSDCSVLIVAGASVPYPEEEAALLGDYVDGGGRLLLMADYDSNSGLEELAAGWGIAIHEDVVVDQSGIGQLFGGGPLTPIISNFDPEHPITRVMNDVAAFFSLTRSVGSTNAPGWSVTELAQTGADSFATSGFTVENGEMALSESAPRTPGPVNVVAAAAQQVEAPAVETPGEELPQGRVVVAGTSQFARNNGLGRGGNRSFLLNILNWLTSDEDLISIRPVSPESTPIDLSTSDVYRLLIGLVLGVPLIIVFAGVRTWWVRR